VRLLGVGVSSLVEAEGPPQLDLFEAGNPLEPERNRVVSRVLDDLRSRFGDDAILPGRMLERPERDRGSEIPSSDDPGPGPKGHEDNT
jgi:hypothetical protein